MLKNERLFYLDFIRALSAVAIVLYHFNCRLIAINMDKSPILFHEYPNGNLGRIGVSLFFIISGAALMYNYQEDFSVKEFLKKRFVSLYPMFWIAYSLAFLYNFYDNGSINHSLPKWTFILTIFGMDGYLAQFIPNFYILGEWFLGCIIIFYLLFPIIRLIMIKYPKTLAVCSVIVYLIVAYNYKFKINLSHNILNRLPEFLFGMYFVKYVEKINNKVFVVALFISSIMLCVRIDIPTMYQITIIGVALFIVMTFIAQKINNEEVKKIFIPVSKYSYAIFLVHNVTMAKIISRFTSTNLKITTFESYCLFVIVWIVIIMLSVLLYKISNKVTNYIKRICKYNILEGQVNKSMAS